MLSDLDVKHIFVSTNEMRLEQYSGSSETDKLQMLLDTFIFTQVKLTVKSKKGQLHQC